MRGRVMLGGPVLAGLIASVAACTKESVKPSAAEAKTAVVESEAAPSASAATADADVSDAAPASGAASAASVDAAPAVKDKDASPVVTTTTTTSTTTMGAADAGAKALTLDESSDGKTVEVARGGSIVLQLAATPSSGFDWAVTKAPPALGAPTMGFVAGGESMGASGKRRIAWTLKEALPAGEHPVELGYARSFEKGVAPFKTFRFKVRAAR